MLRICVKTLRVSLLLALGLAAACDRAATPASGSPPAMPVPVVTLVKPTLREVVEWDEYTGRLEAVEQVHIRARVGGYIDKVNFQEGSKINKDDLLFVIDPRPYRLDLEHAEAEVQRLRARIEMVKSEQARAKQLNLSKAISDEERDRRNNEVSESLAALRAAQTEVERAKLNLEYSEVRAPISGRIGRELVTVGNLISGGGNGPEPTVLATIVSTDPIYVYFDVDERNVLKYRALNVSGERPSARQQAIPVEMGLVNEAGFPRRGETDFVDIRLDPATGTMRARAVFANADDVLSPGFFARVRIPGSGSYQAVLVDERMISTDQNQKYVLTLNAQSEVQYQKVELGMTLDGMRVIKSGVSAEDQIIASGAQFARPGMKVQVQDTAAGLTKMPVVTGH